MRRLHAAQCCGRAAPFRAAATAAPVPESLCARGRRAPRSAPHTPALRRRGSTAASRASGTGGAGEGAALVVGVDLGTTNSAVAHIVDGAPVCIPNEDGDTLTPSLVGGCAWHAPAAQAPRTLTPRPANLAAVPPHHHHAPPPRPPRGPPPRPPCHSRSRRSVPGGRRRARGARSARPRRGDHLLLSQAPHRAPLR